MTEVTAHSFLFAMVGILFVGLSIPLIEERVPPNRYYGFRTPKTLSDPELWYKVNRISGVDLFVAGAVITISSLMMLVLAQAWQSHHVPLTLLFAMVSSFTGVMVHGYLVLRRV